MDQGSKTYFAGLSETKVLLINQGSLCVEEILDGYGWNGKRNIVAGSAKQGHRRTLQLINQGSLRKVKSIWSTKGETLLDRPCCPLC